MFYSKINKVDVANTYDGVCVSLFVSGCRNHCKGCFNKDTWSFSFGQEFTEASLTSLLEYCNKSFISGLTILGGEPMEPENRSKVLDVCKKFKEMFPSKRLIVFSGYKFENLVKEESSKSIIKYADIIVDGKFEEDKYSPLLILRGSSNQRVIDVKEYLTTGVVSTILG